MANSENQRFTIHWDTAMGCYRVSIPNFQGPLEVVAAADYDDALRLLGCAMAVMSEEDREKAYEIYHRHEDQNSTRDSLTTDADRVVLARGNHAAGVSGSSGTTAGLKTQPAAESTDRVEIKCTHCGTVFEVTPRVWRETWRHRCPHCNRWTSGRHMHG